MEYLKILRTPIHKPHNFNLVNCDTDSIAFNKPDGSPFSPSEISSIVEEINSIMPEKIVWEPEGVFPRIIVVAAKNYLLDDGKKVEIKGASLKASMKEPVFRDLIREILECLRTDRQSELLNIYNKYAQSIIHVQDIKPFCFQKTVTKAILHPGRTNESRILDAIRGSTYREGDRIHLFFKTETEYCLRENFSGIYCKRTLLSKLFQTMKIFKSVIDVSQFPNYSLKKNIKLLGTDI